jgi:uncharacterized protein (DUF58 family)
MPASSPTPEQLLRRLEWTVLRRLDGFLQGNYKTMMRGAGLDLADLREYQHGDDVRHIDWNVTARMQTPHVREYREDREISVWFLVDLSPSVNFGSGNVRKSALATEFVGAMGRLLTGHGNRVGALLYGSQVEEIVPARCGRRQVMHLLQRMQAHQQHAASGQTSLSELIQSAASVLRRRSMVFIVSDFISTPGWEQPLGYLARRHEVVAVRLYDPMENELPDLGLLTMEDAETGEQLLVDTHDPAFRHRFMTLASQREADLREALAAAGVDALEVATDDDLFEAMVRFADMRKRRVRSSLVSRHAKSVQPMPPEHA